MNRALLIAVCDFTILSLISIASFDQDPPSEGEEKIVAKSTLEKELFDLLRSEMEAEREEREAKAKALEQEKRIAEERRRQLELEKKLAAEREKVLEEERRLSAEKAQALLEARRKAKEQEKLSQEELEKAAAEREKVARELEETKRREREQSQSLAKTLGEVEATKARLAAAEAEHQRLKKLAEEEKKKLASELKDLEEAKKREEEQRKQLAQRMESLRQEKARAEEAQIFAMKQQLAMNETLKSTREEARQRQDQLMQTLLKKEEAQGALLMQLQEKEKDIERAMGLLESKDRDLVEQQRQVMSTRQQVELAEQKANWLETSLQETRQRMAQEQKVAEAVQNMEQELHQQVESMEQKLDEQQGELASSLAKVVREQSRPPEPLSPHEVYQESYSKLQSWDVEVEVKGLFGLRRETKAISALPIHWADGTNALLMSLQASPVDWKALNYEVLSIRYGLEEAPREYGFYRGDVQVVLAQSVHKANSEAREHSVSIPVESKPFRLSHGIVVDPVKKTYAKYPIRWSTIDSDVVIIESSLGEKMFGHHDLMAGQWIFSEHGKLVGMMNSSGTGRWLDSFEVHQVHNLQDHEAINAGRELRRHSLADIRSR